MLAALSMADHGLFERMIESTFSTPPEHLLPADAPKNIKLIGQAVRDKTVATVMACKGMLMEEPPERMTEFWGTVSRSPSLLPPPSKFLASLLLPQNFVLIDWSSPARVE